jgi:hypothetical protein
VERERAQSVEKDGGLSVDLAADTQYAEAMFFGHPGIRRELLLLVLAQILGTWKARPDSVTVEDTVPYIVAQFPWKPEKRRVYGVPFCAAGCQRAYKRRRRPLTLRSASPLVLRPSYHYPDGGCSPYVADFGHGRELDAEAVKVECEGSLLT